ncbi:MAG: hypothetical protein JST59_13150 [Actinobacteria bacterium]|nr:hypothetical protein [Actinomycetota bacterium]
MVLLSKRTRLGGALALVLLALLINAGGASAACNQFGGVSAGQDPCAPETSTEAPPVAAVPGTAPVPTVPGARAKLVEGMAIAPASAPPAVKKVIEWANRIRTKPYVWGGGHGKWWDTGYDCSGAVSYALRGGGLITSPLDSTGLMSWGEPEAGRWITVYANSGHTYAVIAGLRWDTAGSADGTGPRWYADTASVVSGKLAVRHPLGY